MLKETKEGWRNIALITEYDGTKFAGWQRQAEPIRTVQGLLEKGLAKICGHKITLYASSRTDGGVHALGHVSNFKTNCSIPTERIPLAMPSVLADDVVVKRAIDVDKDFNARYHAKEKTYSYYIWEGRRPSAILGRYSYHSPVALDLDKMQRAVKDFIGYHDFLAFKAEGGQTKTSLRTIFDARIEVVGTTSEAGSQLFLAGRSDRGRLLRIVVTGSGFLYNMVRIMAGTLYYIGQGKIDEDAIPKIIASRDRKHAGITLPPQGLILDEVGYDLLYEENENGKLF